MRQAVTFSDLAGPSSPRQAATFSALRGIHSGDSWCPLLFWFLDLDNRVVVRLTAGGGGLEPFRTSAQI